MLTKRSQVLDESLTLAITALAGDLRARGEDVISFSAGEPDFDTPQLVKDAAIAAIQRGCSKYTKVAGTDECIQAIRAKLLRDNGLDYAPGELIATVGAKHALFECIECLIEEGDEVLIPSPYWVSYPEMVKFAGGVPVFIQGEEGRDFKITQAQLATAITPRTKMLILNSPSNPTGAVYSRVELASLAEVLAGTDITVLSDEMYEKLIYTDEPFVAFASLGPDALARTVTINGLSKCAAMPGWRFGYLACKNKPLLTALKRLQGQSTSNICSITQYAAIAALSPEFEAEISKMRQAFHRRRDLALDLLAAIPELGVSQPAGAFYLFVNISKLSQDSMDFCQRLLEQKKVAVVPGVGFGLEGYFRLSYAASEERIYQGLARIGDFVRGL